jgi:hypothetical protein
MSAEILNFTVEQGATWSATITPVVPIDLTGYTGKCQIRATAEPTSPVIAEPTVTVAVGTVGIHTLSLTAAQTLALPVGGATISSTTAYLYDVFMTKTGIIKQTAGVITVVPAVTRS